jgi:hypothetical protein
MRRKMTKTKNKNNENEHIHTSDYHEHFGMGSYEDWCVECYWKYLKKEGVSNEGFWINPDYMTDEDEFVNIVVKKEISMIFRVRVHKDHKEDFDVEEYLDGNEMDDFWMDTDPYELIDSSTDYWKVVDTQKVSGDKVKDDFFHYVCDEGTFHPPFDESKSVYKEKVSKPKILEVHKNNQRWWDGIKERNEIFQKYQTSLDNMLEEIVEEKRKEKEGV